MQLGKSRKSDDSICRMSLLSHFLLLDQPKLRILQVDKETIQFVEWHLKFIFCLLTSPKSGFGEVEKATFQVVARHWELIFFRFASKMRLG